MEKQVIEQFTRAGVNVSEAMQRFMNRDDLFVRFMKKFIEDPNMDALLVAEENQDVEAAFSAAHTLKGVASNLALAGILVDLVPLVEQYRMKNMDNTKEQVEKIKLAYDKIITVIQMLD